MLWSDKPRRAPRPLPRPTRRCSEAMSSCEGRSWCLREGGKGPPAPGGSRRWSAKQSCGARGLLRAVGRSESLRGREAGVHPEVLAWGRAGRSSALPSSQLSERGAPSCPHRALSPTHMCTPGTPSSCLLTAAPCESARWRVYTATHGHTQQHTTTHGHTQPHTTTHSHTQPDTTTHSHTQPHTATHGHTQPHIITHGHTQSHTATHGHTWPHTITQGHTRPHTTTHGHTQSHTTTHGHTQPHTPHTATHSHTQPHAARAEPVSAFWAWDHNPGWGG